MYSLEEVKAVDPEIAQAIVDEQERQNSHIELIASENWVSKAVMAAMGSILTNKYAEGYPGKRYYGGCECVDVVENLAIERAKELLKEDVDIKYLYSLVGFKNYNYFFVAFKKIVGCTPIQFKKNCIQDKNR